MDVAITVGLALTRGEAEGSAVEACTTDGTRPSKACE
jgi:hypothetical protein